MRIDTGSLGGGVRILARRLTVVPGERTSEPSARRELPSGPVRVRGRRFDVGGIPFAVRGVTYGTFRPNCGGDLFPEPDRVARDFESMAEHGINAVRVYTTPPYWLLDLAEAHGLRVLVGMWWEHHVAFLRSRAEARKREAVVRAAVHATAGHPAVLGYAIGNEVPASIVRWYGRRRFEAWLRRLLETAKHQSPGSLVTYVSYPTTEYLELPFLDFVSFNVYLESRELFSSYLARLHNLADARPPGVAAGAR